MNTRLKHLRSLAWLRRAEIGALARGLLWGLLLPAPCACAVYLLASNLAPPFVIAPARPWPELDSTASDAELSFSLAPFLRGEATLIAGSSEMTRGRDATAELAQSAAERLDRCSAETPLQSLAPAGHAARRAARLLARLEGRLRSARPVRLIVLDNSHYATLSAQTVIEDRDYFLSDADYARYRLQQQAALADADARGPAQFLKLRWLEVQSFRAFLGRRILQPMRAGLLARYAPASAPVPAGPDLAAAPEPDRTYLRQHKAFPDNLADAHYGRALAELSDTARRALPPGSQWRLIALPQNAAYYARLGFSASEIAAMAERRRAVLQRAAGPNLIEVPELAPAELFVDSAHYTAAGRDRLADTLCRVAEQIHAR